MKQLFRIEHPEKGYIGAYSGPTIPGLYECFKPRRHPTPNEDSGIAKFWNGLAMSERAQYKFAFASFAQLRAWFYNDGLIESAYNSGYVINVYNVPDVAVQIGNAQAVFHVSYHTPSDIISTLSVKEGLTSVNEFDYTEIVLKSTTNLNWKTP